MVIGVPRNRLYCLRRANRVTSRCPGCGRVGVIVFPAPVVRGALQLRPSSQNLRIGRMAPRRRRKVLSAESQLLGFLLGRAAFIVGPSGPPLLATRGSSLASHQTRPAYTGEVRILEILMISRLSLLVTTILLVLLQSAHAQRRMEIRPSFLETQEGSFVEFLVHADTPFADGLLLDVFVDGRDVTHAVLEYVQQNPQTTSLSGDGLTGTFTIPSDVIGVLESGVTQVAATATLFGASIVELKAQTHLAGGAASSDGVFIETPGNDGHLASIFRDSSGRPCVGPSETSNFIVTVGSQLYLQSSTYTLTVGGSDVFSVVGYSALLTHPYVTELSSGVNAAQISFDLSSLFASESASSFRFSMTNSAGNFQDSVRLFVSDYSATLGAGEFISMAGLEIIGFPMRIQGPPNATVTATDIGELMLIAETSDTTATITLDSSGAGEVTFVPWALGVNNEVAIILAPSAGARLFLQDPEGVHFANTNAPPAAFQAGGKLRFGDKPGKAGIKVGNLPLPGQQGSDPWWAAVFSILETLWSNYTFKATIEYEYPPDFIGPPAPPACIDVTDCFCQEIESHPTLPKKHIAAYIKGDCPVLAAATSGDGKIKLTANKKPNSNSTPPGWNGTLPESVDLGSFTF